MPSTNFKATCGAWAMEILAYLVSHLPESWRMTFLKLIGSLYGSLPHHQKKALTYNFEILLGLKEEALSEAVRETFINFTITLYDFFFPHKLRLDAPDKMKLEKIRKKYGGVLVLTFHMGNWELGARVMRQWGWPVSAVYQPYTNEKFKKMIESRRAPGVNFIPVGANAAQGVRDALKRGDMVAMLGDHPFGEEGSPVKLLGKTVIWPKGPVLLAVKQKAPIVVALVTRVGPYSYLAQIEDPLIPQNKTRAEVQRLVQEVAHKFGKLVKQYPTQWYRFREFEYLETFGGEKL